MKIFLAGTSFRPEYGGPARSVSQLALALAGSGLEVGVWSADGSAVTTSFLDTGLPLTRLGGSAEEALRRFGRPDVIHDNGIWLPHNHRLAVLAAKSRTPRLVSIRGMLEPWALNHRRLKKRLAWWLYQQGDLRAARAHHVTSQAELKSVRGHGWRVPVWEIPNGVLPAGAGVRDVASSTSEMTALFVGRLHPIKGLPMLVEAWATVRPPGWRLRVVGPDEMGHRAVLEGLVRDRGLTGEIDLIGALEADALDAAYFASDLFILPSHTENFGMAVGEALARGLPVIATQGTPWELLEAEQCGWWVPATAQGLSGALAEATALSRDELRAKGARGAEVVERRFGWGAIADRFVEVYEDLLAG